MMGWGRAPPSNGKNIRVAGRQIWLQEKVKRGWRYSLEPVHAESAGL